ncbi:sigma factor-like helix-turn-helix DNA-binding protein [Saccharothrix sp. Mg75]|uniref:sigma factor-like helix-turn-helix DNA-binding protein n=1 Tax=Saccharothrix sp. Mg75 TaxID=3445357 RepID=UPI003EEF1976
MDRGEDVVRQLYGRWRGPLHGYVLRLVGGDHRRAEEVVRETLLRAWRHAGGLTPDDAGPWLHTVARDLAVSGFRERAGRTPEVPAEPGVLAEPRVLAEPGVFAEPGTPVGPGRLPPVVDALEHVLQGWQVTEALKGLSHDHRTAVVELYYRRRSVAEAASALGVPPGTVKSRCFYALRALRDALEERGVTRP